MTTYFSDQHFSRASARTNAWTVRWNYGEPSAALMGWIPLIFVNAIFVATVNIERTFAQTLVHEFYALGQLLGLAGLSWFSFSLLGRVPKSVRLLVALVIVWAASYALLSMDLRKFLSRHREDGIPWHTAFATLCTLALFAHYLAGKALAANIFRYFAMAVGLAIAVANHIVLRHDYPGFHFVVAWMSSLLIGMSTLSWASRIETSRVVRHSVIALVVASLSTYLIVPGPVTRSALLRSSGSVAAPIMARAWTRFEQSSQRGVGPAQYSAAFSGEPASLRATALPGAPENPIVILLTIDALRADLFESDHKYKKSLPNLLEMKKDSSRFEQVWSAAPYTTVSLRSLFLNSYFLQHPQAAPSRRALGQVSQVDPPPFLGTLLTNAGVTASIIQSHPMFAPDQDICRDFTAVVEVDRRAPSNEIIDGTIEALSKWGDRKLVIYSHIFDPHDPYTMGRVKGTPKQRYLGEVAFVDAEIGRLMKAIVDKGLEDRTFLIISADHGEAFGEHGYDYHATTVYEEMIHVPLLIRGPGVKARVVTEPASVIDLGPTILSLFGIDTPGRYMGQDLVPFLAGKDVKRTKPIAIDGARGLRAMLFDGRYKTIMNVDLGTKELYDLQNDPRERRNLAGESLAASYFAQMDAFFLGLNPQAIKDRDAPLH